MRLMTPAAPVAAVVAARGMQQLAAWSQRRRPLPALLGGLLVGLVAVSVVFPVRPLRNRMIARESTQNLVRVHREELLRQSRISGSERTIDVQVTRLRRKIEIDPKLPRFLHTVRGAGYMLRTD